MEKNIEIAVLSMDVQNIPGIFLKISGIIRRQMFNIESLSVKPSSDQKISRVVMHVNGNRNKIELLSRQIKRIIGIININFSIEKI